MSVEIKLSRAVSACLWLLFAIPALCFAQNTSFTYQGRLNGQAGPANGIYDIRFALYTNSLGADPPNGILTNSVVVSNGLFTTSIDFGNVFDGTPYWLELAVRTNTSSVFTLLTPRQALTAVPYALQAASATTVTGPIPDVLLSTNIPRLNGVSAAVSVDWTNVIGRPNSPVDLLSATHIAPTTSSIYHGMNPGYWLNLGAGVSGMLRQIEFTSPPGSNNWRVYLTNLFLRVYIDAGTTNLAAAPAGSLLVNAPLAVLFGSKYRPAVPSFLQITGSRYLGLNEIWYSSNAVGSFTFNLNLPMPFTNGVLVGLFDANANAFSPWGYSYVSYEPGQLPAELRGWRLHTGLASGSYSDYANITFLNTTNAGELVSIFASFHHSNNDRSFLEGIWYIQSDGNQAPLGCAGGEDMFNNGYYFSFGPQVTYNYGTIHIETPFAVEAYRHFSSADAFFWRTSATAFYQTWPTAGVPLDADILCFYYSK